MAEIDAFGMLAERRKQGQHPSCAGPDIDHKIEWAFSRRIQQGFFNCLVWIMQRADGVPSVGDAFEIGAGFGGARGAHRLELTSISVKITLREIRLSEHRLQDTPRWPALCKTVKHPGAFRQALHQPCRREGFQMVRKPWLALAKQLCQFSNGEIALPQQCENTQPGRLSGSA